MLRYSWPLLIFLGLAGLLAWGLQHDPKLVPSVLIDKPAPAFELSTLDNPNLTFSAKDLLGKVHLLNVWASWCVACKDEHPVLNRLAKMGVVDIIGLNYKDQRPAALGWLEHFGNPYRVSIFDADGRVGIDWGVYGVPETFVLDKRGVIRHKIIGPVNDNLVREELLPLLKQLQAEAT